MSLCFCVFFLSLFNLIPSCISVPYHLHIAPNTHLHRLSLLCSQTLVLLLHIYRFWSQAPMSSQNPQHSVAVTHGGSAGASLITAEELVSERVSRLEQSTVLRCLHLPPQRPSLGLLPPRPHRNGYTDVQSCLETAEHITEKSELSVTLIASLGETLIWNQAGYFSFHF